MLSLQLRKRAVMIAGAALLCCIAASTQTVNLIDGRVKVVTTYDLPLETAPDQEQANIDPLATGLAQLPQLRG